MGRVLTNNTGMNYAIESELGVPDGTGFVSLEPNEVNQFGATITTVARNPISPNRQRRKGTVTDLDSAVEFGADITVDAFRDFIEGFCFATAVNTDVSALVVTGVTGGDYVLETPLSAAQITRFVDGTLVWVDGFTTATSNGLKSVATDAVDGDTTLGIDQPLTDGAASDAIVSIAGFRVPDGTAVTWTYAGVQGTLQATGLGTILGNLGLIPGMLVHFGSVAELGGAMQNAFDNTGTNDAFGYARVVSVSADAVVFDKLSPGLQTNLADPGELDVVFGEFVRNVSVSDVDFLERSFTMEATFPGLGDGTPGNVDDAYQYAKGNYCNTAAFTLPLTDKATVTFGFVGTDTDNPTTTRAASAVETAATGVFAATGNATDGDQITIGGVQYTFVAALSVADDVLIGGTVDDTLNNLIAAVNGAAGEGATYGTGTVANPDVTAAAGVGDTVDLAASAVGAAGNSLATTVDTDGGGVFSFTNGTTLTGASAGVQDPRRTAAFNTSSDIARLRINEADEDGLTTDFKNLTITLNNNVSPEKVIGCLGAAFINTGNFDVDIEAQLLFTNPLVVNKIRDNETVSMDFVLKNDDGVIGVDIPSMTIGGGGREFPVNESVLINTTSQAFEDSILGTSIGVSIIPVPLPAAKGAV